MLVAAANEDGLKLTRLRRPAILACVVLVAVWVTGVGSGASAAGAGDRKQDAESVATAYVTALEAGDYDACKGLASSYAASWVDYVRAKNEPGAGPITFLSTESLDQGDYFLVKMVYSTKSSGTRARYLKLRPISGKWFVVDDGRQGREWVSLAYIRGMFSKPEEVGGIRVAVLGILELPNEFKFDLEIENKTDIERAVYPQVEAYYTAETKRNAMRKYYPIQVENPIDGRIPPKSKKTGFLIFPKFTRDFEKDPNETLEGLVWKLHIPIGVVDQVILFQ